MTEPSENEPVEPTEVAEPKPGVKYVVEPDDGNGAIPAGDLEMFCSPLEQILPVPIPVPARGEGFSPVPVPERELRT